MTFSEFSLLPGCSFLRKEWLRNGLVRCKQLVVSSVKALEGNTSHFGPVSGLVERAL